MMNIVIFIMQIAYLLMVSTYAFVLTRERLAKNWTHWRRCLYDSTSVLMLILILQYATTIALSLIENALSVYEQNLLLMMDLLIVPAISLMLYVLTRHNIPSKTVVTIHYTPSLVMLATFAATGMDLIVTIALFYSIAFAVAGIVLTFIMARRYREEIQKFYSDYNGRRLNWLYNMFGILTVGFGAWGVTRFINDDVARLIFYPISMLMWTWLFVYIRKQKEPVEMGTVRITRNEPKQVEPEKVALFTNIEEKLKKTCEETMLYTHFDLTSSQLALEINCSRSELSEYFMYKGVTFFSYVNNLRLQRASRLLLETRETVGEIGIKCGFQFARHFYDSFALKFGCSPYEYREVANKKKRTIL